MSTQNTHATMCKEKFINPFTDFGFKRLFGTAANKAFLISFLNSLFDSGDRIAEINYRNVEQLGMRPDNRNAIFDLYCTTESGAHIIVEMQNAYQRYFIDRSIYYSSFPMQEVAKRGDWNFELPKIYTVAFLNFNMSAYADDPAFKHVVRLVDQTTGTVFYDKLAYIYLEMQKYNKVIDLDSLGTPGALDDPQTVFDVWMYLIKNLDKFDEVPAALRNSLFERFLREAEIYAFSPEDRMAYEQSLKAYRDYNNTLQTAEWEGKKKGLEEGRAEGRAEGLAEGIEKGLQEGRAEEKRTLARRMLEMGIDAQTISKVTGLAADKI